MITQNCIQFCTAVEATESRKMYESAPASVPTFENTRPEKNTASIKIWKKAFNAQLIN